MTRYRLATIVTSTPITPEQPAVITNPPTLPTFNLQPSTFNLQPSNLQPSNLQPSNPPSLGQTPSGILLPPGVADKLSARAAIAEAEALVAALPIRQAPSPSEEEGRGGGQLLAEIQHLAGQVAALRTELHHTGQRVAGLDQQPNPVTCKVPLPTSNLQPPTFNLQPPTSNLQPSTFNLPPFNLPTFPPSPAAQSLLARDPLFLDLETTGLKKSDRVVEAAIIDTLGHVLFSSLINPGCPIPAAASEVNGVGDVDVSDAPAWPEVLPLLRRLLANRVVVAHNAKFEAKFLPPEWPIEWVCSKKLADDVLGKRDGMGALPVRIKQLGLQPGPAHSAAGDCLSTLRLVKCLAGDHSPVELKYQN